MNSFPRRAEEFLSRRGIPRACRRIPHPLEEFLAPLRISPPPWGIPRTLGEFLGCRGIPRLLGNSPHRRGISRPPGEFLTPLRNYSARGEFLKMGRSSSPAEEFLAPGGTSSLLRICKVSFLLPRTHYSCSIALVSRTDESDVRN